MADNHLLAQGQAKLATEEDLLHDASGITYPNLHRRIDTDLALIEVKAILLSAEDQYLVNAEGNAMLAGPASITKPGAENYILSVSGVNSYRTTKKINTNPDSEIP